MAPIKPQIVFLCVANSARSQMAEGLARARWGIQSDVYSAGSSPTVVNPCAIRVMDELGIDISGQRAKAMDELPSITFDYAITLCAEEICPFFLNAIKRLHWAFPDPAQALGSEAEILEAFRKVRDGIARHIESFTQECLA